MKKPEEPRLEQDVFYPDSDGQPMSDNTLQYRWITTIEGSLEILFAEDPNVFVAGDLLWYPVEGHPEIRSAPDVLVAIGRPKGHRGSYRQWQETNVPPQVVFEIWSPGNTAADVERKFQFYQEHGVEEYYTFDPDTGELAGWVRGGEFLRAIEEMDGWVSPRLKVRFLMAGRELDLRFPDGQPFLSVVEIHQAKTRAERQLALSEAQRLGADRDRATAERLAETERKTREEIERQIEAERKAREEIERQIEAERKAREEADKRTSDALSLATLLAEHLRTLGINPDELRKGG